jgi:uncharacterized protein (DUF1778 family)
VQALLAGGATISADDRNQIVLQAAYQGHQEIADLLRQS